MRRPRPARPSQPRRTIGFEPLEPREMLFADASIDWWSSWDAASTDDWSWAFDDAWVSDDASTSDTAGDAWWTDGWWVEDVEPSDPGLLADEFGDDSPNAEVVDTGLDEPPTDEATADGAPEPGADVTDAVPDVTPVADDETAIPPQPTPDVEEVVVLAPVEQDGGPASDLDDAADVVDTVDVPVADVPVADVPVADVPVADVPVADSPVMDVPVAEVPDPDSPNDAEPPADLPTATETAGDNAVVVDIDVDNDVPGTDDAWSNAPTSGDEVASTTPTDEPEADVSGNEPVAPPTVVVLPSVVTGVVAPSVVPPVTKPSTEIAVARGFGAWGAFFFQGFGRQAEAADGAANAGQPGTGRPRIRLPFRPIA